MVGPLPSRRPDDAPTPPALIPNPATQVAEAAKRSGADQIAALLSKEGWRLDSEGDRAFADLIHRLRGRATVIYVTHRPSHMKLADRVCVLEGGVMRFNGTPAEILPILPKKFL